MKITKATHNDLPFIKEKIDKYWLDGRNISAEQFFIARDEKDKPLGFIRYIEYPQFYEPCTLAVDYYHRGKGVGKMLFEYVMTVINKDKPVFLLTHIPKFFEKYGFKRTDNYPKEIEEKIRTVCRLSRNKLFVMCLD